MKSPLEKLSELQEVIRDLEKISSKMLSGQIILAYRDVKSLEAKLNNSKNFLLAEEKKQREIHDKIS